METTVTTVNNKKELLENCRLIDKQYYLIGNVKIENSGDVYNINGRYIRFNTNRLVYNHSVNEYQLKNDSLVNGIIKFDKEEPIFGYFTLNYLKCIQVILKDKKCFWCINENVFNLNYREELSTGIFYHISLKPCFALNLIKKVDRQYKESLNYDSKDILEHYMKNYDENYKPVITPAVEKFSPIIEDLTFGLEFETTKGIIPNNKLSILPLIPLRDGSIEGLEYVTIPLSGKKGVQAIIDSVIELDKRTEYNNSCSLHYHIGNIPRTPEFILAFYKVISNFQDELFELFPLYKKYNFGVKRKSYSKPFPFNLINSQLEPSIDCTNEAQLNKNFKVLFDYFAEIIPFEAYNYDLDKVLNHPLDERGQAKWNINTRYYAVNFIPLIFGNKKTIEFRIHTPTYNIDKILNFLFINSYLINYTKKNYAEILSNPKLLLRKDLNSFISDYIYQSKLLSNNDKDTLVQYHIDYVNTRKDFIYNFNTKGDITGNEDLIKFNSFINWKNDKKLLKFNKPQRPNRFQNIGNGRIVHSAPSIFSKSSLNRIKKTLDDSSNNKITSLDLDIKMDDFGFNADKQLINEEVKIQDVNSFIEDSKDPYITAIEKWKRMGELKLKVKQQDIELLTEEQLMKDENSIR